MDNTSELREILAELITQPLAQQKVDMTNLYTKVDASATSTQARIDALACQVTKTNGRVTELERDDIRRDTEMKMIKAIGFMFIAPIVVALAIWGIQSFITIAIK